MQLADLTELSQRMREHKVRLNDVKIILFLDRVKRCTIGTVHRGTGITDAQLSRSIRRLVTKKIMFRNVNTSDLRSWLIGLTGHGKSLATSFSGDKE
jgi:DNA-binding MarR family transcriptional regulator